MHNQKSLATAGGAPLGTLPRSANTINPINTLSAPAVQAVRRITSDYLMQDKREVEIEHSGKIYRLRITQLNKLILTA